MPSHRHHIPSIFHAGTTGGAASAPPPPASPKAAGKTPALAIAKGVGPQSIGVGVSIAQATQLSLNGTKTIQGNISVSGNYVNIADPGTYLISWSAVCDNGTINANLRFFIVLNNNVTSNAVVYAFDGNILNLSGTEQTHIFGNSELALLKAGDKISISAYSGGTLANPVNLNNLRLSVAQVQ